MFYICFVLSFLPLFLLFPIKKIGKENLKKIKGQNYIIACNHMSNMDPVMLDITLKKKFRFLAKKELFKNKFISFVLKAYGGIPVDRDSNDTTAIRETFRQLNNGKNVAIFPQGTRCKSPDVQNDQVKVGVAMFAIRTNTPVVPMVYDKKIRMFHRTKLIIGSPLIPDESKKKDKDYLEEFRRLIASEMSKLLRGGNNEDERF